MHSNNRSTLEVGERTTRERKNKDAGDRRKNRPPQKRTTASFENQSDTQRV